MSQVCFLWCLTVLQFVVSKLLQTLFINPFSGRSSYAAGSSNVELWNQLNPWRKSWGVTGYITSQRNYLADQLTKGYVGSDICWADLNDWYFSLFSCQFLLLWLLIIITLSWLNSLTICFLNDIDNVFVLTCGSVNNSIIEEVSDPCKDILVMIIYIISYVVPS